MGVVMKLEPPPVILGLEINLAQDGWVQAIIENDPEKMREALRFLNEMRQLAETLKRLSLVSR